MSTPYTQPDATPFGFPPPSPSPAPRSVGAAIAFHLTGAILTAITLAGAWIACVLAAFATSSCTGVVGSDKLRDLRLSYAGIGCVAAAVPLGWALIARRARYTWQAWAGIAALIGIATIAIVATTQQVEKWCLF